jgi:hypothetical protein
MDTKYSLSEDISKYYDVINKSLQDMRDEGLFEEDPMCACTTWLRNVDEDILDIIVDLMNADEEAVLEKIKHMDDFVVFIYEMQNVKQQSDVGLTHLAVEKLSQTYMMSAILEKLRRSGEVEAIGEGLPLDMIKYQYKDGTKETL